MDLTFNVEALGINKCLTFAALNNQLICLVISRYIDVLILASKALMRCSIKSVCLTDLYLSRIDKTKWKMFHSMILSVRA